MFALIVSRDLPFATIVGSYCEATFGTMPGIVSTADAARHRLAAAPPAVVFVDLMTDDRERDALRELLAECLSSAVAAHWIVRTLDGFVPRTLAAPLALLRARYLAANVTHAELHRALDADLTGETLHPAPPPPLHAAVQGGDLSFRTYTPELFSLLEQLLRVARHDVTLLFVGETGTGKTTLAQLVHQLSPRSAEPFQNVACGALPPDLIESELFGHLRGAFTSAERSKIGRFEAAGGGTLLLDEIDVLGPKEQAKLLKVIETGEFEPVGSTETRRCRARLIVASNVDLDLLAQQNRFRSDLYYRLNVLQFGLPPLRQRPNDVIPLAMQFIDEACRTHGIEIAQVHHQFLHQVGRYRWPGNLRELKNQMQRSVLFSQDGRLRPSELSPSLIPAGPPTSGPRHHAGQSASLAERVALSEREILEQALRANGYQRTATAKALGISRVGLYKKMRRLGLHPVPQ